MTLSSLIKVKQRRLANHTIRGLRYTRLILERLGLPDVTKTGNGEWIMGNGEWGMGNGERGLRNGEWGMGN